MDGFLMDDAPKSTYSCKSTEDLQLQFQNLREAKVTESKAHHLSATFELSSTAVFQVPEEPDKDVQNHDADAPGSPDATPEAVVNENAPRPTRNITAHDALMNQPADDPALQRAVAKHIITSLGAKDGSSWSVRTMSRGATGWTFQYICKNSTLAWKRQNAKHASKVLIAESSGKDGVDPVTFDRPAFDCRGSITIAFPKNSRRITVKFEHTPLHKTVKELAEIFKPAPAPNKAVPSRRIKAVKKKKSQAATGENGAEGTNKKKRKKPASDPSADGQAPKPKKAKARPSKAKKKTQAGKTPEDDAMLNLSPSEAARRADEARRKLSESGIDPATLSQEQFDIFANQSPELQNESLAMLVKYGAERLRIVHPTKDDGSSAGPAQANGATPEGSSKKKKSSRKSLNPDGTPKVKKTRGSCQACKAKKNKCSKAKPECNECMEAGIECYYPPQQSRQSMIMMNKKKKSAETAVDEDDGDVEPAAAEIPEGAPADVPADIQRTLPDLPGLPEPVPEPEPEPEADPEPEPEPEPEPMPEEEASDLGSPGFHASQHVEETTFPEVSHDLYQPGTGGLSYPSAVQDDLGNGMDYSYSSQIGHQQAAQNGMAYPHQPQQVSNASYHEPLSASHQPQHASNASYHEPLNAPPAPEPEPVQPVQAPAQPAPPQPTRAGNRRSLPSGSAQNAHGYSNSANTGNGSAWQPANAPVSTAQAYAAPVSPRQSRRKAAPAATHVYDNSQNDALAAAATLSQAALRKAQPSPTTRTVSPFQNPTQAAAQAARAKSRQGHRAQSRATASPFQQTSSKQPAAVDTASIYNSAGSTEPHNTANYDQYSRYNTATPQSTNTSSRGAYDSYPQQANSTSSSTSYAGYDGYNARSQPSTSTPLAAPATRGVSATYTKTTAPNTTSWANSTGHRTTNSYGSNNVAAPSNSAAYTVPAASTQQQSASMQSFNVRPQPSAQPSRTNTPTTYSAQQQSTQQPRQQRQQQQQSYNSYSSQSQSSTTQPSSQSQQQQDWYGFSASNSAAPGYGTAARGAGYGQSGQQRPAAMNIAGSTYQTSGSLHDQEVYEMFRHPPAH